MSPRISKWRVHKEGVITVSLKKVRTLRQTTVINSEVMDGLSSTPNFTSPYPPTKAYGPRIGLALTSCIIEILLQEKASNTD